VNTDAERKALSTRQARLALVGVVLRQAEADNGGRRWIDLRTRRRVGAVA